MRCCAPRSSCSRKRFCRSSRSAIRNARASKPSVGRRLSEIAMPRKPKTEAPKQADHHSRRGASLEGSTCNSNANRSSVNGVKVAMLTAGQGEPLVLWHGAGTWHGFDFALPWASRFRVMIPFHPGWGESATLRRWPRPATTSLHYLEMFDQLGLRAREPGGVLDGRTLGRDLRHRASQARAQAGADRARGTGRAGVSHAGFFENAVRRRFPDTWSTTSASSAPYLPKGPDPEFAAAREREGGNFGKLLQNGLMGPWLPRWLHRVNMPTLIAWGEKDRILPAGTGRGLGEADPPRRRSRLSGRRASGADEKPECVEAIADFLARELPHEDPPSHENATRPGWASAFR